MAIATDDTAEKEAAIDDSPVQADSAADLNAAEEAPPYEDNYAVSEDDATVVTTERAETDLDAAPEGEAATEEADVSVAPDATGSEVDMEPAEVAEPDESGTAGPADREDLESGENADQLEFDRTTEVPALLGGSEISGHDEPVIAPDQPATDDGNADEEADKMAFTTDSSHKDPQNLVIPESIADSTNIAAEHPATGVDMELVMRSLQDSLANMQYISAKIDAVSSDTNRLINQVNSISSSYDLLTAEMESFSFNANTKSFLSKTFLTISSVILIVLVVSQIYMFISQIKTQQLQNAAGSTVLENINSLNKKMADYDKHLTKSLEQSALPEHARANPPAADKTVHETPAIKETVHVPPVHEKLNKMRSGLPEKKLIRKETGDWFVFNKKNEECISDVEVIEILNQAYRKIGRSLSPKIAMPSHNAVCLLKPDGKGGTEVVMTKDFLP